MSDSYQRIDDQTISQIIQASDIAQVIASRVELKKKGHEFLGLCPFHTEKTPSFSVIPRRQMYYCFGCQSGGNVINFLMKHDHLTFIDAIKMLASSANIPLKLTDDDTKVRNGPLYAALSQAAKHYQRCRKHKAFEHFMQQRQLNHDSCERFALGYADDHRLLTLKHEHCDVQAMKTTQMFREKNGKLHVYFYRRIMFPIRDTQGRVIAFGGRCLDDRQPKYLNSAQSPIFTKRQSLYGLYEALKAHRQLKSLFVVEGYMDVIAMAQGGISNVVASLGTAITLEQIVTLRRYTDLLIFCFDGDLAGKKAAWKAATTLLPSMHRGLEARFIFLPKGHDPDSIMSKHGKTFFVSAYRDAPNISDYFLDVMLNQYNLSSIAGKHQCLKACMAHIEPLANGIYKNLMITALESKLDLQRDDWQDSSTNSKQTTMTKKITKKLDQHTAINTHKALLNWIIAHPQTAHALKPLPEYMKPFAGEQSHVLLAICAHIKTHKINNSGQLWTWLTAQKLTDLFDTKCLEASPVSTQSAIIIVNMRQYQWFIQLLDAQIRRLLAHEQDTTIPTDQKKQIKFLLDQKNLYNRQIADLQSEYFALQNDATDP